MQLIPPTHMSPAKTAANPSIERTHNGRARFLAPSRSAALVMCRSCQTLDESINNDLRRERVTDMSTSESAFKDGHAYTDVYFLKIDASGHSTIVVNNPSDVVNLFFDHFENTVIGTVEETRKLRRCGYAEFWGWEGDGGLCVIYDENESVALQTAVESGISILNYKLQPLQDALKQLGARGELHVRIALHGGSFRYKGYKSHGSIHSKDLNFVAHLEEVTPRDTLAVSRDVQQRCPTDLAKRFWLLPFRFEDHEIYVYSNRAHPDVVHEWVSRVPIAGSVARTYFRIDTAKKTRQT